MSCGRSSKGEATITRSCEWLAVSNGATQCRCSSKYFFQTAKPRTFICTVSDSNIAACGLYAKSKNAKRRPVEVCQLDALDDWGGDDGDELQCECCEQQHRERRRRPEHGPVGTGDAGSPASVAVSRSLFNCVAREEYSGEDGVFVDPMGGHLPIVAISWGLTTLPPFQTRVFRISSLFGTSDRRERW
jgi:hypothetical protein